MTRTNRFSILAVIIAILLGGVVDEHTARPTDTTTDQPTVTTPYVTAQYGTAETATALAAELGCWEDEVLILVIADVLPDDGTPPNVDWGPVGLTGELGCVPADNLPTKGNRP